MKKIIKMVLMVSITSTWAAKPATTADVDIAASNLQTQINTLNATINAIPAIAHPVGSCYGGGVVFYASGDANAPVGQRGLIAAPTDAQYQASSSMAWQTGATTTVTTSKTYFTGFSNTSTILGITGGTFPAASAADDYSVDGDTCAECTKWYLPSQDELATLYAQSTSSIALGDSSFWSACGGIAPLSSYWSSTQGTVNSTAFSVNFLTGIVTTSTTGINFRVRAVRAF